MKFESVSQPLAGLKLLERSTVSDERGEFSRLFCSKALKEFGWGSTIQQSNVSTTIEAGTIRGLHFQRAPHAEAKLVSCIAGQVFDVALDLREHSETFGQWFGCELSATNYRSLLIPKGFAHGFQTLMPNSTMIYFHSSSYEPKAECGVKWDDPDADIDWPLEPTCISARDKSLPSLASLGKGISV